MKTAYELAMERMGGVRQYSEKQKKQFAEIDSQCDADAAQARFSADAQLKKIGTDSEQAEKVRAEVAARLATDLERIERKREKKKSEVRAVK